MKNDDDKRLRKIRDKDKAIRLQQRRRDKLAARYYEENYFDGVLTDKSFAYPAQNGAVKFVDSENGK